jgi:hypothetical protein
MDKTLPVVNSTNNARGENNNGASLHVDFNFASGRTHSAQRRPIGRTARIRVPAGSRYFSLLHSVQTDSEGHSAYLIRTRDAIPGGRAAGAIS